MQKIIQVSSFLGGLAVTAIGLRDEVSIIVIVGLILISLPGITTIVVLEPNLKKQIVEKIRNF